MNKEKEKELKRFLVKAKKNTYVLSGEGKEKIFYNNKKVYELSYHGGFIEKR